MTPTDCWNCEWLCKFDAGKTHSFFCRYSKCNRKEGAMRFGRIIGINKIKKCPNKEKTK